jgi:uncharacterized protein with PIN domain
MRKVDACTQFTATFYCCSSLQALLLNKYRESPILYLFNEHPGIKDAIEAMGVPHTEVDAIVVNGCSVEFNYQLQHHDVVNVYPAHVPVPVADVLHLTPQTPEPATFILDVHLGKLARRLRLLGFDCLYQNDFGDAEIIQVAQDQGRIILTRDRGILKHRQVRHGYLVRSDQVTAQVREVLERFLLSDSIQPWLRCMACNGTMEAVAKSAVEHRLEPKTTLYYEDFHRCIDCDRLYWQGSHFEKIELWLSHLTGMH